MPECFELGGKDERQRALRFRKVAEPNLVAGLTLTGAMRKRLEKSNQTKPARVAVDRAELVGAILIDDLVDSETGEVIAAANTRITDEVLNTADEAGIETIALATSVDKLSRAPTPAPKRSFARRRP